jgi:hypothetical protein
MSSPKTPQFSYLSGTNRGPVDGGAMVEDVDGRHLRLILSAEVDPISYTDGAREHAHVGDLVVAGTTLDLEHRASYRTVGVARGRRQQFGDSRHEWLYPCSGHCRTKEDWMH